MVNCSLHEGLGPEGFKKAVVTPLIKKASLPVEELKNYCPVSGLSFISKLVERVVAKQLVDHIHRHGLDNSYQSAYKSGHSMERALLSIKNDIHLSLSRGEATALVLLDLSAAFDTIDHSTLLSCLLDWFGVGGSAVKWFSSYLTECYQSVKISSTLLDLQKVPWCTSFFILVSLNISLHIYPHIALLTILVRVLPISSMYQNFNLQFTRPLSSLASVLPLMLPLLEITS